MPIYEYECHHCNNRFEIRQSFHDKPQADCPACGKKARRVFHPSPIIFKGSGFYVTDHRKKGDSSTGKATPDSGKAKTESPKTAESGKEKPESKKSAE
jgi:putative FmdB family regulatory protein